MWILVTRVARRTGSRICQNGGRGHQKSNEGPTDDPDHLLASKPADHIEDAMSAIPVMSSAQISMAKSEVGSESQVPTSDKLPAMSDVGI